MARLISCWPEQKEPGQLSFAAFSCRMARLNAGLHTYIGFDCFVQPRGVILENLLLECSIVRVAAKRLESFGLFAIGRRILCRCIVKAGKVYLDRYCKPLFVLNLEILLCSFTQSDRKDPGTWKCFVTKSK